MKIREAVKYLWGTIKIIINPDDPTPMQFGIEKMKRKKKAKRKKEIEYIKIK